MGEGIDRLSRQEPVQMREKGMASELAGKLNRTSSILQKQKEKSMRQFATAMRSSADGTSDFVFVPKTKSLRR